MRHTSDTSLPNDRCPLCMGDNECAISRGDNANNCWCMSTPISPQQRHRASKLGYELNCLCKSCGAEQPQTDSVDSWPSEVQVASR